LARKRTLLIALSASLTATLALLAGAGYLVYRWLNRPRPDSVEVVAVYPGALAEDVERQVTIPLEVTVAGMPGLAVTRSRSTAGRCTLRLEFDPRMDDLAARQEVANRLQYVDGLPAGVTPQLSAALPRDAVLRIRLTGPRDARGRPVYTLHDLTALRDGVVRRELALVPGVAAVEGSGGAVKRYEVQPDPERLRKYGISLQQLANALAEGNGNVGDEPLPANKALNVRGGQDPIQQALAARNAQSAAAHLRAEEQRRLRELREIVITTINQVQVRVGDVVDGGRLMPWEENVRGVVIGGASEGHRLGEEDRIEAVILRRRGEAAAELLRRLRERIDTLNGTPGKVLPGVQIEIREEGAAAAEPDDFAEAFEASRPGSGLVKIFGDDLEGLEGAAQGVRKQLEPVAGVEGVRVLNVMGRAVGPLVVDRKKCARWNMSVADMGVALSTALEGAPCTQLVEGVQRYDVMVRWPQRSRRNEEAILELPMSGADTPLRLRDVVTPPDKDGDTDPNKPFVRRGPVAIYRENGKRLIAVRFHATSSARAAARHAVSVAAPFRAKWGGR
jgi:Cu/Ag efflux pump CusA